MQFFLVLLFLGSHVAAVTAVAGCHSDWDRDHRTRQNCTTAGFSDVPPGLEPTTKVLLFPNNVFSSLSWSSFQIFTQIYEIDLTGNKVPKLTSSAALMLPSLSVLRLGSNRLTSLLDGSFSACPALTELYLDNNALNSLSDHTFSGLSKLEILDLSSNSINVLPKLMLHPLPAIETLYLENNKIKLMPDHWFSMKEEVPYLFLSANPWACYCTLDYLRRYIDEYELNIYVQDGPIVTSEAQSVVCGSPERHHRKPLMSLDESDLCSPAKELGPRRGDGHEYNPDATIIPDTTIIPTSTLPTSTLPPSTLPPSTSTLPTSTLPTSTSTLPTSTLPTSTSTLPTSTLPTSTSTLPTSTLPTTTAVFVEALPTEYPRVVTWSWYQRFTRVIEWSGHSGSTVGGDGLLAPHATFPTAGPSTVSPANATPTKPKSAVTPELQATTAATEATTTSTPASWVSGEAAAGKISATAGAGVFCFWLFAGCLLLCVALAVCLLATVARLVVWYRRVYEPLSVALARRGGRGEVMRLLPCSRREEKEVGGGGVMALYRSVLYVQREGGDVMEREDGGKERPVTLEPAGGGGAVTREGEGGREEKGVYRKTLYRLLSKEEEMEGWRNVMEECRVSAGGGGRRQGEVSRKCYSVILREEREEAGGGREEQDWVVGGWEVKRGGGGEEEGVEPRSSWGEWLAHYLPNMPWGVTTPPQGEPAE